jgi:hypothetical protein
LSDGGRERSTCAAAPDDPAAQEVDVSVRAYILTTVTLLLSAGGAAAGSPGQRCSLPGAAARPAAASGLRAEALPEDPDCIPPAMVVQPSDVAVHPGEPAGFQVVVSGSLPISYQWRHDGLPILGAVGAAYTIPAVQLSDAGVYTCTATNSCGQITSDPATLTVCGNPALTLLPLDTCLGGGELLEVRIELSGLASNCPPIVGGQFRLQYDPTRLTFLSAAQVAPFVREVHENVNPITGTLDYAVGADPNGGAAGGPMAVLTFAPLSAACAADGLLVFRAVPPNQPPTRLSDAHDLSYDEPSGTLTLTNLPPLTIDPLPPALACPPDLNLVADPGGCNDTDPGAATAADNCDPNPALAYLRSDGKTLNEPFCAADSPITITWTATDACGNAAGCAQTVTVAYATWVQATVQFAGNFAGLVFTRCITFDVWNTGLGSSVTVPLLMTFSNGVANGAFVVPPGVYDCIQARDRLHTLRRTATLTPAGGGYLADFTTASGNALLGGNFNDDPYIDIIDFGLWAANYGLSYGTPHTTCSTPAPHLDVSGNGIVEELDFSFVQINFWQASDPACSGPGLTVQTGPRTTLAVSELPALGLSSLAGLDANVDGWVDLEELASQAAAFPPQRGSD